MKLKRIFMNEADSSPGGGAVPPVPAQPPASNGASAEPVVPVSQLKAVVGEAIGDLKNAIFADLRRSGALGKDKPASDSPAPSPAPAPATAPASSGLSALDVKAMLEQSRVMTRAAVEHRLTDAQTKRMESALDAEKPADIAAWTSSYLADMGLVKASEQPTVTTVPQPAPNGHPISDKGSPAPGGVTNWQREFAENPVGMSSAARQLMDAELGVEVARKKRVDAGLRQGNGIKVTRPQG